MHVRAMRAHASHACNGMRAHTVRAVVPDTCTCSPYWYTHAMVAYSVHAHAPRARTRLLANAMDFAYWWCVCVYCVHV
eukprot:6210187-Pleurochrysis_carterae.AAC.2